MSQSIIQLTSNLWVLQSRLYFTNSGVFLSAGRACLVDPGIYPDEIQASADLVAQDAALQTIILTHGHWDHILGPEFFPGVKTIAQANYSSIVSGKHSARIRRQIAEWETHHDVKRTQPFVIPHPDEILDETATLAVGDISLHLHHAPGHAADQLVIYHPLDATLWAADMLSDLEIPFVCHNLAAYQQTLAMLSAWDVQVLIPGHGRPTSNAAEIRTRISDDIAYLAELREKVQLAIQQGKTIQETVALCDAINFRHPEENQGPHQWNVEHVYLELGGQADQNKVGWNRLLNEDEF
jgi:glyoxylase-like metal-dependent hydrolase (beta-lactamase superfamily II)